MNELVIDIEATGALRNKAHPFDYRNQIVLVGCYDGKDYHIFDFLSDIHSIDLFHTFISSRSRPGSNSRYIGFNFKFDLHYLVRYGIDTSSWSVWDCQLAEFIISKQQCKYPSLNETCGKYELGVKLDLLKEYYARGVDTDQIPRDELIEYLKRDLKLTWDLYQKQKELIKPYWNLFNIQCQDLKILQEMEFNGMKYSISKSNERALDCLEEEQSCKAMLKVLQPEECINWSSNYHLSAVLYGGAIRYTTKEPAGTFKTGAKAGQVRYAIREHQAVFPRLVEPLNGSQLQNGKDFSTSEDTLRELKATGKAKAIINYVLKLSELEKLRGTYFEGIPKRFVEKNWDDEIMHGNINQCVAITGRTSSSDPNLQNQPPEAKECFVSRFK